VSFRTIRPLVAPLMQFGTYAVRFCTLGRQIAPLMQKCTVRGCATSTGRANHGAR
jgi:hypothetical protein